MAEKQQFTVHKHIIFRLINDQASTVSKALMEGVMNSTDANASQCTIDVTDDGFVIQDDGQGFRNKDEIREFFGQFGKPHEDEGQDVPFGRFRMGRGQIFAFASTRWLSGPYAMNVDVKNNGLDYEIEDDLEHLQGCRIEGTFYERLSTRQHQDLLRSLPDDLAYLDLPVYFNGEQINTPPSEAKWDHEDEHAYYSFETGRPLHIYNMGVFVQTLGHQTHGIGGTVVSKNHLALNTSRHMVLDGRCPEWDQIKKVLREAMKARTTGDANRRKKLDRETRERMLRQLVEGELSLEDVLNEPVLMNGKGRGLKPRQLIHSDTSVATVDANASAGVIDQVTQATGMTLLHNGLTRSFAEAARVVPGIEFDRSMLDDPEALTRLTFELFEYVARRDNDRLVEHMARTSQRERLANYAEVAKQFETERKHLYDRDLPPRERAALRAIRHIAEDVGATTFHAGVRAGLLEPDQRKSMTQRKIVAGSSDDAWAWTDGQRFIAIDRRTLKGLYGQQFGMRKVINTLVHEYCHSEPCAAAGDPHDDQFTQLLATVHEDYGHEFDASVWKLSGRFVKECTKEKINLPAHFMRTIEKIEALQKEARTLEVDDDVSEEDELVASLQANGDGLHHGHEHGDGCSHDAHAADEAAQAPADEAVADSVDATEPAAEPDAESEAEPPEEGAEESEASEPDPEPESEPAATTPEPEEARDKQDREPDAEAALAMSDPADLFEGMEPA